MSFDVIHAALPLSYFAGKINKSFASSESSRSRPKALKIKMAQDRKLLVTFTTLVCLVFAASLSGLPVVPVSGAVVPELVPRSGQQWSIAQTW